MSKVKGFFRSELGLFLVLAFGGAWPLQCVGSWLALRGSQTGFTVVLSISMFMPLAALLLVRRGFGHEPTGVRWKLGLKGRWKQTLGWWIAAFVGPAVFCALGAALYYALFPHRLDLTGSYILAAMGQAAYDEMTAMGLTPLAMVLVTLVQGASLNAVINAVFAVGEEAGWRGFLQPQLQQWLGCKVKASIVGGVIWGAWHWPVMLLAAYDGTNALLAYAASADCPWHMGKLLSESAKACGGKGGGRPDFAQGSAPGLDAVEFAKKAILG